MKIALAQQNFHIGNFQFNFEKIKNAVASAKNDQADLIVFPELAITGYPPRDFLEFDDFHKQCQTYLNEVKKLSSDIGIIVGAPSKNNGPGKSLYNSAYFFSQQKCIAITHKTLLPTYDVFDEVRYFEENHTFETISFKDKKLAITICEDIWNFGPHAIYQDTPLDQMTGFDAIINIAASPFNYNQVEERLFILKSNCQKFKCPIVYVNQCGAQTELIFDGCSMVMNQQGELIHHSGQFNESVQTVDVFSNKTINYQTPDTISQIHDALVLGIRDYFSKLGFKKALIGLSGGIDSAVTHAIAVKALGPENVHGILMPSQYSSDHSIQDAIDLCKNQNCSYDIVQIKDIYHSFMKELNPLFKGMEAGLTEENLQARIRGTLLMAYSNKHGHIVLNTSNKSEAAVGYGTLYGDMCGGLSVIADVYKLKVYELAEFINKDKEIIPRNTITKEPSAELRPDQKDSDSLPAYEILDQILELYIEKRTDPDDIIAKGFDPSIVKKAIKLVNINEYKRHQTPPILRVTTKAFGMGRRMPIVAKYLI